MNSFGEVYCATSNQHVFEHPDACYFLSFATIMLNVDLHNPCVKLKKTMEQFISQNRGVNNKKDFEREMQVEIYTGMCYIYAYMYIVERFYAVHMLITIFSLFFLLKRLHYY